MSKGQATQERSKRMEERLGLPAVRQISVSRAVLVVVIPDAVALPRSRG